MAMHPRLHLILAAVLGFFGEPSLAQKRPMTFEDVISVKEVTDPRVSPDGRIVIFVVDESDLAKNATSRHLWRYDVGSREYAQLTRSGKQNRSPRWSPDGNTLAFLSDRGGKDQVYLLSMRGGEPRALTDHATAVLDFEWSPDGSRVAFTAADPVPAEREKLRKEGDDALVVDAEFDWPKLWLVEVGNGGEKQILTEDLNVEEFAWSPDGATIALRARPTTLLDLVRRTEIYLIPSGGGALSRLTQNDAAESGLVWSSDGRALFYTAPDASRFINAEAKLFRLDVQTREVRRLAAGHEYGIGGLRRSHDGRRLYFLSGVKASERLCSYNLEGDLVTVLAGSEGAVLGYDVAGDEASLAFVFSDTSRLPELWTGTAQPFSAEAAPALNTQAADWLLGETRVTRWRSRDGWEIEGLLTLPLDYRAGRTYPLMVVIHGGPYAAYALSFQPGYTDYSQVLAGRGWAVLRPNYRGGSNYGDAFARGMDRDTGGGDYHDIMTGVDHLIAEGIADPERMGVMGWSWGGISTGWIVTQTDRFRAASAGAMVSNHFSVFGAADLTYDVEYFYIGGSPYANAARYLSMSPIGHVMKAKTPTLLIHGMEDIRCPYPQSVEFYKGLQAAGVKTRLVAYPREPHVFREPRHQLDKMRREYAWFEEHVLGFRGQAP
ncbi:MAG: S9 family peptidase [Acidobacteria bacterium]|nr:S9 family peptidase [Acidobacteriota bacterium]